MRIVLSLLAICTMSVFLSACNTMQGAGEDIQSGGAKLSQSAADAKN